MAVICKQAVGYRLLPATITKVNRIARKYRVGKGDAVKIAIDNFVELMEEKALAAKLLRQKAAEAREGG